MFKVNNSLPLDVVFPCRSLKTHGWPWVLFHSLVGLLSLWNIPLFHSLIYCVQKKNPKQTRKLTPANATRAYYLTFQIDLVLSPITLEWHLKQLREFQTVNSSISAPLFQANTHVPSYWVNETFWLTNECGSSFAKKNFADKL